MVYVASTRALAVLEIAVHLDRSALLGSFVLIPCRFDEGIVIDVDRRAFSARWRRDLPPPELATIGDTWAKEGHSAVLAVPSVIIEEEINFLLNPKHPDFSKIKIGNPEPFEFDQRLMK